MTPSSASRYSEDVDAQKLVVPMTTQHDVFMKSAGFAAVFSCASAGLAYVVVGPGFGSTAVSMLAMPIVYFVVAALTVADADTPRAVPSSDVDHIPPHARNYHDWGSTLLDTDLHRASLDPAHPLYDSRN